MIRKIFRTRYLPILFPIVSALALFFVLNLDCRSGGGPGLGSLEILYTSDAGGAIDPCG